MQEYINNTIGKIQSEKEEMEKELQVNNISIENLLFDCKVNSTCGYTKFKFVTKDGSDIDLDTCGLVVGDLVNIRESKHKPLGKHCISTGEVYKIKSNKVTLLMTRSNETKNESSHTYVWFVETYGTITLSIDKVVNEFEAKVINHTLNSLTIQQYEKYIHLFNGNGNQESSFKKCDNIKSLIQESSTDKLICINNPNDTCKVKNIVDTIEHLVERGDKVLVYSPSRESIEFINDKLTSVSTLVNKTCIIGGGGLNNSIDNKIKSSEGFKLIKELRNEIKQESILWYKNFDSKNESNVNKLKIDVQNRIDSLVKHEITNSNIILSSCITNLDRCLKNNDIQFDCVIIDTQDQTLPLSCWYPILKGKKVLIVIDHKN